MLKILFVPSHVNLISWQKVAETINNNRALYAFNWKIQFEANFSNCEHKNPIRAKSHVVNLNRNNI